MHSKTFSGAGRWQQAPPPPVAPVKSSNEVVMEEIIGKLSPIFGGRRVPEKYISIQAPTGYGKTTLIPLLLLTIARSARVIIFIPNIKSVHAAYNQIQVLVKMLQADLKNLKLTVGQASDSIKEYEKTTNLVIATYGHGEQLAQRVYEDFMNERSYDPEHDGLASFDYVIFDEYHDPHSGTRFIPAICRMLLSHPRQLTEKRYGRVSSMIFMSATPREKIPALADVQAVRIVLGSTRVAHKTEIHYLDPGTKGQTISSVIKKDSDLQKILETIFGLIKRSHKPPLSRGKRDVPLYFPNKRVWLVFLPGRAEIDYLEKKLKKEGIRAVGLTAKTDDQTAMTEIMTVAQETEGPMFVILATNVVESSITIPGVQVCVISGLRRISTYNAQDSSQHLDLGYISKNSFTQEGGRVGRTEEGVVVRVIKESTYEALADETPNDIDNGDISKLVLGIFLPLLDDKNIEHRAHQQQLNKTLLGYLGIPKERFTAALNECVKYGLLSINRDGEYTTPVEMSMLKRILKYRLGLPASVVLDCWLIHFKDTNLEYPGIVFSAYLDNNGPFMSLSPRPSSEQVLDFQRLQRQFGIDVQDSTIISDLKVWLLLVSHFHSTNMTRTQLTEYDVSPLLEKTNLRRWSASVSTNILTINHMRREQKYSQLRLLHKQLVESKRLKVAEDRITELLAKRQQLREQDEKLVLIGNFDPQQLVKRMALVLAEYVQANFLLRSSQVFPTGYVTKINKRDYLQVNGYDYLLQSPPTTGKMILLKGLIIEQKHRAVVALPLPDEEAPEDFQGEILW